MDLDDGTVERRDGIGLIKVIVALLLFPLIPVVIAFNVVGIADRLSFLPGISRGGGITAGAIAFVYVFAVFGIAAGGGIAASGADLPYAETSNAPEPTTTPRSTVTHTPTATPIPTPAVTSTATPVPSPEPSTLQAFEVHYRSLVNGTWEYSNLTDVPILATEYRENDQGELELWVVFWECDFSQSHVEQRLTVTNDFGNTVRDHSGAQPDGMRVYAVTNLTNFNDTVTYIPTSDAEETIAGDISLKTYTDNWVERLRDATETEREIAYQMAFEESGEATAHLAFNVDHESEDLMSCNGGAKPGEGSDDYDRHVENTAS